MFSTASDKILRNKAFNIAKNPKYDAYQRNLRSMVCKFSNRKTSGSDIKNENMLDHQLEELHKTNIRKFKKTKVHWRSIDNIWGVDLADMQFISKFNKGFKFLCVIDIFSKYARVIPLKVKKRYYNYQYFSENFKKI